jgi:hypothetical protein
MAKNSEQPSVSETVRTDQPRKQRLRQRGFRLFGSILGIVAILFLASMVRMWLLDRAIERRLIGTWSSDHIQADASVSTFTTQFQSDGTMLHFDQLKPFTKNGQIIHGPRWRVRGGILCLDYHDEPRSVQGRIRQFAEDVAGWLKGKKSRAYIERQRCLLDLTDEETISIKPHPDERDNKGWVGDVWSLTREK